MKITEITKSTIEVLGESLSQTNTTGFSTEDLMAVAKQHLLGEWIMDEANQSDNVVFRYCNLYLETFAKHAIDNPNLGKKVEDFKNTKIQNHMQPFGRNDTKLISAGPLGKAIPGLRHAHLTQDISLFYTVSGSNPCIFTMYGFFSHKDSGTGNASNPRIQKSLATRLANQDC